MDAFDGHLFDHHLTARRLDLAHKSITVDSELKWPGGSVLGIDPAHVRRKFYEQAIGIGLQSSLGTPETIRKSRAVELMRSNMPLQVVQKIMGHSTPNLAASYVEFSDTEIKNRATAEIVVRLPDGTELCAIITEKSRKQMGIKNQDTLWAFFDAFAVVLHVD